MRFAHVSDIHLGFQKHESLQKIEREVFEDVIDQCIARKVDFVLIPGDIFHVNIPEMRVQRFAFAGFRRLYEAQIPAYVVYGSHDFSPVSNSVIDLLEETGYLIKAVRAGHNEDGSIRLDFLTDPETGAKIVGLSGLKAGRDKDWYEKMDRESLESESGFKIFLFHGGISDMKADSSADGDHMPLSLLPRGFSYYAGGHMHRFNHREFSDYSHVVYPGTPFAGYHADLEENARGQRRGFVIVEFEDVVKSVEFVPIEGSAYEMIEIDANNRRSESVNEELQTRASKIDSGQKIVLVKIHGELTSGKTSDVDVSGARQSIVDAGALAVSISRNQLVSREYSITDAKGADRDEVETNVFRENIGQLRFSQERLLGEDGIGLAKRLLCELGRTRMTNEKKGEYVPRILDNAMSILEIDVNDS